MAQLDSWTPAVGPWGLKAPADKAGQGGPELASKTWQGTPQTQRATPSAFCGDQKGR